VDVVQFFDSLFRGRAVAHSSDITGNDNNNKMPVILSDRSESKNPPKLGAKLIEAKRLQPCGDPSTRSSNSLAQGDMSLRSRSFLLSRQNTSDR
jgi:hypothetical protein